MMTPETIMTIGQQALQLTLLISAPLLLTALAAGLIVSLFQAATQINEMTLSFIPKIVFMAVVLLITGPWMLRLLMDYTRRLIENIPSLVG
ncbi:flagellar biosynthesis protein FliQ [Thermithiobacillus tepidarius]|uniref:flagellar biosynthesis protein FliQ n=1 Tax=Thermithiobacillus tepidarius TaxID=929 RepID=UPI0004166F30